MALWIATLGGKFHLGSPKARDRLPVIDLVFEAGSPPPSFDFEALQDLQDFRHLRLQLRVLMLEHLGISSTR